MSRLVNLGPGDLSDRLTILALKQHYGEVAGKDIAHFRNEATELLTQIRSRTLNGKWFAEVLSLAAVNAALWRAEDDLRGYRNSPGGPIDKDKIVELAFSIQAANDKRAELIQKINLEAGEFLGVEKL